MLQQQVMYDFAVYNLPMPADMPVTILTVGRSLLHAAVDVELPLTTAGKHDMHSGSYFCCKAFIACHVAMG